MHDKNRNILDESVNVDSLRRIAVKVMGSCLMIPLLACGKGEQKMKKETVLALVLYSYLNRPIHDIVFSGTHIGVANAYGGTGIITSVRIPFGRQVLSWTLGGPEGMARNGENVQIKNSMQISREQISAQTRYIGIHLYPDDTAELSFAEFIPERTIRGAKIMAERK